MFSARQSFYHRGSSTPPDTGGWKISTTISTVPTTINMSYSKTWQVNTDNPAVTSRSVTVDWGDGSADQTFTSTNTTTVPVSHTYTTPGTYVLEFTGSGCMRIGGSAAGTGFYGRPVDVLQWGSFEHTDMFYTLTYCQIPEVLTATDQPLFADNTGATNGRASGLMFYGTAYNDPKILTWDLPKKVKIFSSMFGQTTKFNQPIGSWDMSQATSLAQMFQGAQVFNQPLNNWDVSKVTNFSSMFAQTVVFNQDLSNWKPTAATYTAFSFMFGSAAAFNQDLSKWDMSNKQGWAQSIGGNSGTVWNKPRPPAGSWQTNGLNGANYQNWWNPDYSPMAFVFKVTTTTANETVSIRTFLTNSLYPHFLWGDGSFSEHITSMIENTWSHTYATPGTYAIQCMGYVGRIKLPVQAKEIVQWGLMPHTSYDSIFDLATTCTITAPDQPLFSGIYTPTWGTNMFKGWTGNNVNGIENWNMVGVTQMTGMFQNATNFNQNLSHWCVPTLTTKPTNFDTGATSWTQSKPVWGTCPP